MRFISELSVDSDRVPVKSTAAYEIWSGTFGRTLRAVHRLSARTIETLRREKISELEIFSSDMKEGLDLNILRSMPELKSLSLLIEKPIDWTPLQHLKQIQKLILRTRGCTPQQLDFSKLRHLHTVR